MRTLPSCLLLALLAVGCCSGSPNPDEPSDRVTIYIHNDTAVPVAGVLSGSLGAFSMRKEIVIGPQMTGSFWVPRKYIPSQLDFKIVPIERVGR